MEAPSSPSRSASMWSPRLSVHRPHLACGTYDGADAAVRWIDRVRWDFEAAGMDPPPPNLFIRAIYMNLRGEAARFIDETPKLHHSVVQAASPGASSSQLQAAEMVEALQARFPDRSTVGILRAFDNLAQNPRESLWEYFERAQDLTTQAQHAKSPHWQGEAKDTGGNEEDRSWVRAFQERFIRGLSDTLLQDYISFDVIGSTRATDSYLGVYTYVHECAEKMEQDLQST